MTSKTHWLRPLCGMAFLFMACFGWTLHGAPPESSWQSLPKLIADSLPSVLPLLAVGLAGAMAAGGPAGLRGGLCFLLGGTDDARAAQAQRALRAGARGVVSAGLVLSLLAAFAAFLLVRESYTGLAGHPSVAPALLAGILSHTLFLPIVALAIGSGLLTSAADSAALACGGSNTEPRHRRDALLPLLFLLPGLMGLFAVVWPLPRL